ncbi:class I mannose-6-phosphate isomerase [Paenibacillus sp. UMB7766-LJ446]|uniref:class I mannose-6-phosphate isomerase n=1 Tax=Paenibacillus sp. UMB7766-LJ446 TaxID=3046313 RepID=UPI00254DBBC0|nr:class I mannose-6-phosphate isomerase [Paenibacillus sp. UMB7766-LJ446]MDK8189581.1 class I mannose-6-phosphate isomerase [Paenibacillus sp. UMB7766-LJ446]
MPRITPLPFHAEPVNFIRHQPDQETEPGICNGYEEWLGQIWPDCVQGDSLPFYMVIDGTHGTAFSECLKRLRSRCHRENRVFIEIDSADYLKPSADLLQQFHPYLTDNRAFGVVASDVSVEDYFRPDAQSVWLSDVEHQLRLYDSAENAEAQSPKADQLAPMVVTFGPGSGFLSRVSGPANVSLFCDLSRESQQNLHQQGMGSLGLGPCRDTVETYKQALFLEWPVWEEYRKRHLYNFDYYVDTNNQERPVLVTVPMLRRLLASVAQQPFRVKPFFAPGIWGGQYLKELCGLPREWNNCAWGFEPIAPENTLLIGYRDFILDLPFPLLLSAHPEAIMGERNVRLFGDYFPIRFDYLDTIDGDHLSLQVHPQQAYIEQTFNETMTQQESYYIMEQKEGAKPFVGLGFTEGTTGEELLQAVESAHSSGKPLKVEEYVNILDANKGDLFLIPPGAVHFSGKNNLVLEISSTTWWFTFKIYDHLRVDRDGRPRPINSDHARSNMQEKFDTRYVQEHLIAVPRECRVQGASCEELLGEREDLLFQVKRLKLDGEWIDDTAGEFVMFNLVEGERVRLTPLDDEAAAVEWGYAEAYIVPASVGAFRMESLGDRSCTLIRAQVSPEWNMPLLPHHWKSGGHL